MKKIFTLILIIILSKVIVPQSIVISSGASLYVSAGSDICAGGAGNITGNLIGEGTQCGGSLPVELTSFTAEVNGMAVVLKWNTETEVDNYGFEIHRKVYPAEGRTRNDNWGKISFVEGNGNSNSPKSYSFTDKKPMGGSQFKYRLKQIDTDGKYEYSKVIEVEIIPNEFTLYQNYPNPFNPNTKIRYQLPQESKVIIKLYDILGAEVITLLNEEKEPGVYEVDFTTQSATGGLPSGTYIYRMAADNFIQTKKMVLMK